MVDDLLHVVSVAVGQEWKNSHQMMRWRSVPGFMWTACSRRLVISSRGCSGKCLVLLQRLMTGRGLHQQLLHQLEDGLCERGLTLSQLQCSQQSRGHLEVRLHQFITIDLDLAAVSKQFEENIQQGTVGQVDDS